MNKELKETILTELQDAQMVLIGLGDEIDLLQEVKACDEYKKIEEKTVNKELYPFLQRAFVKKLQADKMDFYHVLFSTIKDKNYFIISTCQDGVIHESELDPERIVEPCGTIRKLQCQNACCKELTEVDATMDQKINAYLKQQISEQDISIPKCSNCNENLVFNTVHAEHYLEEGYQEQWNTYLKWLQGTINRKLCVLELGVGLAYPTVIRWPFEKTVFFNQKAKLFRVHSRLYQTAEEIKEKAVGICEEPAVFLNELSKECEYDKLYE